MEMKMEIKQVNDENEENEENENTHADRETCARV